MNEREEEEAKWISFQLPFNSEKREAEGRTNVRIRLESSINQACQQSSFLLNKTKLAAC